jgi:hypothetical protein
LLQSELKTQKEREVADKRKELNDKNKKAKDKRNEANKKKKAGCTSIFGNPCWSGQHKDQTR